MGRRPPARKPSFMKILVKDFSNKLLIPPKFVRLHRGTLARKCILRPTGTQDSWLVRTKQINNLLYFKKGWKKFVQHHSLGFGDLLVFRYAQDREFYVDMFDKSCCNKEPVTPQNVGFQKDTTPILPNASQEKKADSKTRTAIDAAEELVASTEFPTFMKVLQKAYVRPGGYMPVILDFAKKHLKDNIGEVSIEVSGKTWTVGVAREGCSSRLTRCWGSLAKEHALKAGDYVHLSFVEQMNAPMGAIKVKLECRGKEWDAVVSTYGIASRMNNGWSIFARENSLQIGDACVFELINREDALIRVTIFKCRN